MTPFERIRLLARIVRWRLTWSRHDLDYLPKGSLSAHFKTARQFAELIPDTACVLSCGIAGNARCAIFVWALRERFLRTGKPEGLTWIAVAGQGGRGRVPGTVEEVAIEGLLRRFISGHTETTRAQLRLAAAGKLELHTMAQGEMTHVIEAQGRGERYVHSTTGVGSFLDPRCGRGSPVTPGATDNLIEPGPGDQLTFTLPAIDVALFNAPYADREGNLYFRHAATITENLEAARAARRNGGLVCATVCDLVEKDPAAIDLPASEVDVIVVNPYSEQTGAVPQRRYWRMFTAGAREDAHAAVARLRFVNETLGITPRRDNAELAMARLAARTFSQHVAPGATVNIGVGLGEEVCRVLHDSPLRDLITFTTESGPYGGLPAPGVFFGAAINPLRLESSAWMFHHYRQHLDAAVLGFLELDAAGNINLSRRGDGIEDYVGPGGAPSIIDSANTVIFVGKWMIDSQLAIRGNRVQVIKPGRPKIVERVSEVTFNAAAGLARGKQVFYVTDLAVLALTPAGLRLHAVMPGVDIKRDLLANTPARIIVPDEPPPVVPGSVVSGKGFQLHWEQATE